MATVFSKIKQSAADNALKIKTANATSAERHALRVRTSSAFEAAAQAWLAAGNELKAALLVAEARNLREAGK